MNFKEKFKTFFSLLLDKIYPPDFKCVLCGGEKQVDEILCDNCKKADIFNNGNRCIKCDTPLKDGNIICDHCKNRKRYFVKATAPLFYEGNVRKSILELKSQGARYKVKPFAKLMFARLKEENIDFDYIVPVPSHPKTIKKRGYNVAKLLADELGILSGKEVKEVLVKNVLTKSQKDLSYEERQTNLQNSMTLTDKKLIKGKKILIVDDIITTCATVNACAGLLTKASSVYVVSIARTLLNPSYRQ